MMAHRDDTPAKVLEKQRLSFLREVLAKASADKKNYVILFKTMMAPGMQNLIEKHKFKAITMGKSSGDSTPLNLLVAELKLRIKRDSMKPGDLFDDRFSSALNSFTATEIYDILSNCKRY